MTLDSLNARIDAVGHVRAISVLRIALGPIVWLHLRPFIDDLRDGVIWSDRFTEPYVSWYPEAGRTMSSVLLWTAIIAAGCMSLGIVTRVSALVTTVIVTHNLFLSTTYFAHNRAFLVILLVTVTVLPSGRHLSVDAVVARRRSGSRHDPLPTPLWPLWLVRFEIATVYLASAISKLIDGDWWGGRVLQLRAIHGRELALDAGAPGWILDVLADADFQWWFSKGAVITEFFIGAGLLFKRTRLAAIWVAIPFHVAIQIGAAVQVFSWAALAALVVWVTPTERDRTLAVPQHRHGFGELVRRLDWFGRFEIVESRETTMRLTDRDGGPTLYGDDARWMALSRLPATAFAAIPIRAVRQRRTSLP